MRRSSVETRDQTVFGSKKEFKAVWTEFSSILRHVGIVPPVLLSVKDEVPEATIIALHNTVAAVESQMQYVDPLTLVERVNHDLQVLLEDKYIAQALQHTPATR